MMRLKVIIPQAMAPELSCLQASCKNLLDVTYLQYGDHENPDDLRGALQACIDITDQSGEHYDAIVLAYGLCGGGICGVKSTRFPVIVPRAHDCATLVLGSHARYRKVFEEDDSAFLFVPGWLQYGTNAAALFERYRDNAVCVRLAGAGYGKLPACIEYLGDGALLRGLIDASWEEDRYLTALPNATFEASYTAQILRIAQYL